MKVTRFNRGFTDPVPPRWIGVVHPSVLIAPESSVTLASIAITGTQTISTYGGTTQFTATGTYSDATTADLTAIASWSTSAASVATVSIGGLVTRAFTGTSTITATVGSVSGTRVVTCSARMPATAAEMATACGGYGTWTHGWNFQEASGTAAAPSWGTGDITLGADCTAGVTGLATVSGDKAYRHGSYTPGGDSSVPADIVACGASDDIALVIITSAGTTSPFSAAYTLGLVPSGGVADQPRVDLYAPGAFAGTPLQVAATGYAAGDAQVSMVVVEDNAVGYGSRKAQGALATAHGHGAATVTGASGAVAGGSSTLLSSFYGTGGDLTLFAVAKGTAACASMVANADTIVASLATYVGLA